MAIKFLDGCDTNDRDIKWYSGASGVSDYLPTSSNFGTGCIQVQNNSIYKYIPGLNAQRMSFGGWFKAGAGVSDIIALYNSTTTEAFKVSFDASDYMTFTKWNGGTCGTTTHVWRDNNWHWLDFDVYFHASAGTLEVWVDGYHELSFSGNTINSGTPSVERFFIGAGGGSPRCTFDDVIFYDDTAGGLRSSVDFPLTAQRIETIRPSGDDTAQWTPSTGTSHYALVNKTATDTSTYVQDNVSGDKDIYIYGDLTVTPNTIKSIVCTDTIENSGTLAVSYQPVIVAGGTEYDQTAVPLFNSYVCQQTEYLTNPNTGTAWTKTAVDATKFGVKVA